MHRKIYYKIGEVSKILGVSTHTLRYYDEQKIFCPSKVSSKGYRLYSIEQLEVLDKILKFRNLGLSIKELKQLSKTKDLDIIFNLIEEKQSDIQIEINKLNILNKNLEKIKNNINRIKKFNNEVTIKSLEKKYFYVLSKNVDEENFINDMMKKNKDIEIEWLRNSSFALSIDKNHLINNDLNTSYLTGFISEDSYPFNSSNIITLDYDVCAYYIYKGDIEFIDNAYFKIINWINENELVIKGDSIEINTILLHNENTKEYFSEIYIPIVKK